MLQSQNSSLNEQITNDFSTSLSFSLSLDSNQSAPSFLDQLRLERLTDSFDQPNIIKKKPQLEPVTPISLQTNLPLLDPLLL